jgi:hypothetical protein
MSFSCLGWIVAFPRPTQTQRRSQNHRTSPLAGRVFKFVSEHAELLCESDWLAKNLIRTGPWLTLLLGNGLLSELGPLFDPDQAIRLLLAVENDAVSWRESASRTTLESGVPHGWKPFSAACVEIGRLACRSTPLRERFLRFSVDSVLRRPFLWNARFDLSPEQKIALETNRWTLLEDCLREIESCHWSKHPCLVLEILLRKRAEDGISDDVGVVKDLAASALWTDNVEVLYRMGTARCLDSQTLDLPAKKWFFEHSRPRSSTFCAIAFPVGYARSVLAHRSRPVVESEIECLVEGRDDRTPLLDSLALACKSPTLRDEDPICFREARRFLLTTLASSGTDLSRRNSHKRDRFSKWTFDDCGSSEDTDLALLSLSCARLSFGSLSNLCGSDEPTVRARFCLRAFYSNGLPQPDCFSFVFGSLNGSNPEPGSALATLSNAEKLLDRDSFLSDLRDSEPGCDEAWSRLFPAVKKCLDAHSRPLRFAWSCSLTAPSWNWPDRTQLDLFLARVWTIAFSLSVQTRPEVDLFECASDLPPPIDLTLPPEWNIWQRVRRWIPPDGEFWLSRSLATVVDKLRRARKVNGGSLASVSGRWDPLSDKTGLLSLAEDPRCRMSVPLLFRIRSKNVSSRLVSPGLAKSTSVFSALFRALKREDLQGSYFQLLLNEQGETGMAQVLERMDDATLETCAELLNRSRRWIIDPAQRSNPEKDLGSLDDESPDPNSLCNVASVQWIGSFSNRLLTFSLALEDILRSRRLDRSRLAVWTLLGIPVDLVSYRPCSDYPYMQDADSFPCQACQLDLEKDQLVVSFSCAHPVHLSCAQALATVGKPKGSARTAQCPLRCEAAIVSESLRKFEPKNDIPVE